MFARGGCRPLVWIIAAVVAFLCEPLQQRSVPVLLRIVNAAVIAIAPMTSALTAQPLHDLEVATLSCFRARIHAVPAVCID
eukprot:scaffold4813_cov77-Phaeocystis_antarctica.AAC.5